MRILLFACLLISTINLRAQENTADTTSVYRIETNDGNEYIGTIISRNSEAIVLKTVRLGEITLRVVDIVRIETVLKDRIKNNLLWFDNVQATRYFFQPNGYGLKKGEAYYQNIWVVFNQVSYGFSDHFSLGVGIIPTFLFSGSADGIPFWLTPKLSIPLVDDRVNVGVGVFYANVLGGGEGGTGIAYALSTFGNKDKNLTIGIGYGFSGGELGQLPAITFSTMIRTGQRGYFISENYFLTSADETLALVSIGGRRIIKRAGLDFGLFVPYSTDQNIFFAIPWLGLTFRLDKKKN
ncbi:hypothetical protein SanaruYs_36830 [Chryseotalea sanaruensis]|uniref:Uncharacterized protein n=1 Tax=Chryseotalea sanaruensis TaxID=2482724 RepID=A0A401UEV9_9BACT|nr:hypothetical protein [Chryseotalea sanaruensis]GCC53439.1 hypothetical protein SanaruYs_36830 [Chryseotalea sanaruensis]